MTQEQRKLVSEIFKSNPSAEKIYMNPRGEFFTEESYALNSLPVNKNGGREGKLETVNRQVKKK